MAGPLRSPSESIAGNMLFLCMVVLAALVSVVAGSEATYEQ